MNSQHKRKNTAHIGFEPNEGERALLCCNKGGMRSPSLDLGVTPSSTEDELISILAGILVDGFMWEFEHGEKQSAKGSHLLPGIN